MFLCRMFCESKPCIGGSNEFVFESTAHPKLRIFTVLCFWFPIWLVGSGTGQLSAVNCRIWWPKLIFLYQDKVTCPIGQAWYGSYLSVSHNYPSGTIGRELWWTLCHHVNSSPPSATYMHQWIESALVQRMPCRRFNAKPLSKPMLGYCQLDP